ncbi:MAG TPA: oligosaccharide flippase family protein, partial [Flavisolibacter sp.]|nr:oligosaccharide flippase family protein [Flavisolibacter sp.]
WTLAFFLFAFSLASFGYDQLVIRKAAEGKPLQDLLSLHLFHVLFTGGAVYVALIAAALLAPSFFSAHPLLLLLGFGKLLLYVSVPFKAITTGSERFRLLLWMSVVAAVLKGLCLSVLSFAHHLTLPAVVLVFLLADALELVCSLFFFSRFFGWHLRLAVKLNDYRSFFKAALPQVGTVLFAAALARADWLLIGLFLSPANLAEYSFAYKAFEISSLPLLVIAPLLVPWFTRLQKAGIPFHQHPPVQLLLRAEIMIACFTALCLNLLWNPFIDNITGGRYGAVNSETIFILSLTLPVLYLNNFFWSLHFAKGNLRIILYNFALCFLLNVAGNIFLLPLYGNVGAAIAYLLSV